MQEKLVIYLNATDLTHPSWAVVDSDGSVRQSTLHDNAEGLAQIAEDKTVIVLVPAEDVLLTATRLPKMNRTRLAQALPYALEEQLIEDVSATHFAPGEYLPEQDLPVAVVSQAKMREWLALLQAWHIVADVLIPSSLALPLGTKQWHVAIHDYAIIRTGNFQGFACDKNNFNQLLELAFTLHGELPQLIHLHNATQHAFVSALDVSVDLKEDFITPQQLLGELARNAVKTPAINLLQGIYAVKKSKLPKINKLWKSASYLAAAWVGLLFFYPLISSFILGHRVNVIENEMLKIYKHNFPAATSVVAPKLRLQEKLQKMAAEVGENRLLLLLAYVGKGIKETPSIKLNRTEFQNNQLTLELTAASSEDFSAFTDFLSKQGLSVKQQNANLVGAHVNASLLIE